MICKIQNIAMERVRVGIRERWLATDFWVLIHRLGSLTLLKGVSCRRLPSCGLQQPAPWSSLLALGLHKLSWTLPSGPQFLPLSSLFIHSVLTENHTDQLCMLLVPDPCFKMTGLSTALLRCSLNCKILMHFLMDYTNDFISSMFKLVGNMTPPQSLLGFTFFFKSVIYKIQQLSYCLNSTVYHRRVLFVKVTNRFSQCFSVFLPEKDRGPRKSVVSVFNKYYGLNPN